MDKKAEAYKKYNNAAVAQMMIEVLPQIVENVAKPISAIKDVNIYSGDGNGNKCHEWQCGLVGYQASVRTY